MYARVFTKTLSLLGRGLYYKPSHGSSDMTADFSATAIYKHKWNELSAATHYPRLRKHHRLCPVGGIDKTPRCHRSSSPDFLQSRDQECLHLITPPKTGTRPELPSPNNHPYTLFVIPSLVNGHHQILSRPCLSMSTYTRPHTSTHTSQKYTNYPYPVEIANQERIEMSEPHFQASVLIAGGRTESR